ncbi:MAG: tetraacyldisaccharide 4'-kinase [Planctomycetota bacterium]|nr:tetraacyldisaccharide 4'-kinase [Planctomycetota bacterium]
MQVESARYFGNYPSKLEFADQRRKTAARRACDQALDSFAVVGCHLITYPGQWHATWQQGRTNVDESRFRNLVSGQSTGILAYCLRMALSTASAGYRLTIVIRNRLFDRGWKVVHRSSVPVISVGNITTGGTGKTPIVAMVCQMLLEAGTRPGIVSRGYRSVDGRANDEKLVLNILCPGTPHEQNPDRVAAARLLTSADDLDGARVSAIVMDDGFQHRRLHRDLNIVLIDATNPFGYEHLLPRGLMREPLSSLRRADVVIITRSDLVDPPVLQHIEQSVIKAAPQLVNYILRVVFQPTSLRRRDGSTMLLKEASGMAVHLMAGIGNPDAFQTTAARTGMQVTATSWFPDHHLYTHADLEQVRKKAAAARDAFIVTTLKDLVKLPENCDNVVALEIAAVFPDPKHSALLQNLVQEAYAQPGVQVHTLPSECRRE